MEMIVLALFIYAIILDGAAMQKAEKDKDKYLAEENFQR